MAVKARATIELCCVVDIEAYYCYYLLQSSSSPAPSKPTTNPPGGNWGLSEPGYTAGYKLYTVDLTVYSDGTFVYSDVNLSSSYEAARQAYELAQTAGDLALQTHTMCQETDENLNQLVTTIEDQYAYRAELDPSIAAAFGVFPTTPDEQGNPQYEYYDGNTRIVGTLNETIRAAITTSASSVTEEYTHNMSVELQNSIDGVVQAVHTIDWNTTGLIKRGYIWLDEDTRVFGIVVSCTDVFNSQGETARPEWDGNHDYYEIGNTGSFGLYTADGWQFWQGGKRVGWFDAKAEDDEALHVEDISVQNNIIMDGWILAQGVTNNQPFWGLKYIGA